jgi:hypothetical protein
MRLFIAPPAIERRHARQRIAEKPSRQVASSARRSRSANAKGHGRTLGESMS